MNRTQFFIACACLTVSVFFGSLKTEAQVIQPVQLPEPRMNGGRALMEVLSDRKSSREYSSKELTDQQMSDLLWAAFGINRAESGKRTAPSAHNKQEIDIYAATSNGLFTYNAVQNKLIPIVSGDIKNKTGTQGFVKVAPLNLIYVADFSKVDGSDEIEKYIYASVSTGAIVQNVYLYCASEGLATVVRGSVNKEELAAVMKLGPGQNIIVAQTVGYPKE